MTSVSEILDRHRQDWDLVAKLRDEALQHRDMELLNFAKIFAETVSIMHEGERKSYAIDNSVIDLVQRAQFVKTKRMSQGEWRGETHEE